MVILFQSPTSIIILYNMNCDRDCFRQHNVLVLVLILVLIIILIVILFRPSAIINTDTGCYYCYCSFKSCSCRSCTTIFAIAFERGGLCYCYGYWNLLRWLLPLLIVVMLLWPSKSISTSSDVDAATASPTTTPIATAADGHTFFFHLLSPAPILIRIRFVFINWFFFFLWFEMLVVLMMYWYWYWYWYITLRSQRSFLPTTSLLQSSTLIRILIHWSNNNNAAISLTTANDD